jgi:hypothetical protein
LPGNGKRKPTQAKRIFGMWLACLTQDQIAKAEGIERQTVSDISASFAEISRSGKSGEAAANHQDGTDEDGEPKWKAPILIDQMRHHSTEFLVR